jgi:calcium/calmodulin-dependent protein kinase I
VRSGRNKATGQSIACKCIDRTVLSPDDEFLIRQEVKIMGPLSHQNIVKLIDFFEEEKSFYVILEFVPGGELFDRIVAKEFYNEQDARDTVRIICTAMKYCHDLGIVHRGI